MLKALVVLFGLVHSVCILSLPCRLPALQSHFPSHLQHPAARFGNILTFEPSRFCIPYITSAYLILYICPSLLYYPAFLNRILTFLKSNKIFNNTIYNKDSNELLRKINGDVLYIDPPYTVTDYNSAYHVLESISK